MPRPDRRHIAGTSTNSIDGRRQSPGRLAPGPGLCRGAGGGSRTCTIRLEAVLGCPPRGSRWSRLVRSAWSRVARIVRRMSHLMARKWHNPVQQPSRRSDRVLTDCCATTRLGGPHPARTFGRSRHGLRPNRIAETVRHRFHRVQPPPGCDRHTMGICRVRSICADRHRSPYRGGDHRSPTGIRGEGSSHPETVSGRNAS